MEAAIRCGLGLGTDTPVTRNVAMSMCTVPVPAPNAALYVFMVLWPWWCAWVVLRC